MLYFDKGGKNMEAAIRTDAILNYYEQNPGCDPNMFEFVGLCDEMVKFLNRKAPGYGIHPTPERTKEQIKELYPTANRTYDRFQLLVQQFGEKLLGNDLNVTKESPLFELYRDLVVSVNLYSPYNDIPLKQMLGGVALYMSQKQRDLRNGLITDFVYDNATEMAEIERLYQEMPDLEMKDNLVRRKGEREWQEGSTPRQMLYEEIKKEYARGAKTR